MFYQQEYKKQILFILLIFIFILFLSSCSGMSVDTESFFTMDTIAESTVITKKAETGKEANEKIKEICNNIENLISNTVETSEIYKINDELSDTNNDIIYNISKETADILETAKYMKEQTKGAFNPNLGEIIDLWGINKNINNEERKLPEKASFYPALEKFKAFDYKINHNLDGDSFLVIGTPLPKFDLGAVGKGYAIDKISDYLIESGISHALVSFSSSILAIGKNKTNNLWNIGLKDPINPSEICGYLSATDKIISVSGGYERFIQINEYTYCHIIDPETGYPVDNDLLCVVVVMNAQSALKQNNNFNKNGAISDALSTALYVMGKEKALDFYNNSSIDFEMILFVKKDIEDISQGYDIIPTNVIFNEITK